MQAKKPSSKYEYIDERERVNGVSMIDCKITFIKDGVEYTKKIPLPKKTSKAFNVVAGFFDYHESMYGEPDNVIVELYGVPKSLLSRLKRLSEDKWELLKKIVVGDLPPLGLVLLVKRLKKRYGERLKLVVNGKLQL